MSSQTDTEAPDRVPPEAPVDDAPAPVAGRVFVKSDRATAADEDAAMRPTSVRRLVLTLLAAATGFTGLAIWRGIEPALFFVGCASATALLIPPVARWAWQRGILAFPGGRDIHGRPTPRGGGAALFVPLFATLLFVALAGDARAWGMLVGGCLVFAVGMLDDVHRASPRLKICVQVLAGLALVLAGLRLPVLGVPGLGSLELGLFEIPLILFWVVLATNAFNLSDGLDGLATSLAILGLAVLTAAGVPGVLPVALAGACLGFLHYNLPAARIFLGDSGSLLLGFLLAALTLELPATKNLPLAIAVFAYSLGDVAIVTFRRWIRAKPLFAADKSHVHHKILQYLGHPLWTLTAVLILAGMQSVVAVFWPGLISLNVSGLIWIVVGALLIRAGNYKARSVLNGRPRMRELHLLRRYVLGTLALAESRDQVERVLRHLLDGARLCELSVHGMTVREAGGCAHVRPAANGRDGAERSCQLFHVTSADHAAWWRAAPSMSNRALAQERATIVKDALMLAAERLERGRPAVPTNDPRDAEPLAAGSTA